jgi:hypothetical protein
MHDPEGINRRFFFTSSLRNWKISLTSAPVGTACWGTMVAAMRAKRFLPISMVLSEWRCMSPMSALTIRCCVMWTHI